MSVSSKAPIAIGISLAANASPAEVNEAIDLIRRVFNVESAPGVTPAAAAAVAQNTTPAVATGGVELDTNGLPYDDRIHSGSRSKTDKGVWTKKRGVSEADFNRISTELRAAVAATGTSQPAVAPTLPAAGGVPSLPALPGQAGPVVPALPSLAPTPYQNFVAFIATQLQSPQNPTGRINSDWVDAVIAQHGVPGGIANLAAREDLIPGIETAIKGALGIA
jgi:hypothetical protein